MKITYKQITMLRRYNDTMLVYYTYVSITTNL